MPIRPDQLQRQLARELAPVYLIGGEEPLFVREAEDAVRAAARAAGCDERVVLEVESGFDWNRLAEAAANLSLFGDRRLIELRLPTGKPGVAGSKAIASYCAAPSEDAVLLIATGRLEAGQRKSAWASAVERAGVFVYGWPLPARQLPQWITQRLTAAGLAAPPEAVALLAERAEGNLLAAVQEIDKLRLLFGAGELTQAQIMAAVADSARYTIYDLAEAVLAGQLGRSTRVLQGLRQEGVEPTLVLWVLARDLRVATGIAEQEPAQALFSRERIYGKAQQAALQQIARRAPAAVWRRLLQRAARVDKVLKGVAAGRIWDELLHLTTTMTRVAGRQAR